MGEVWIESPVKRTTGSPEGPPRGWQAHKRWAEYLTLIATSLLIPLELHELAIRPTLWKAGGILINVLSVSTRSGSREGRGSKEMRGRAPPVASHLFLRLPAQGCRGYRAPTGSVPENAPLTERPTACKPRSLLRAVCNFTTESPPRPAMPPRMT